MNTEKKQIQDFLDYLVGEPLCYGIKSPDIDLYDFGFGRFVQVPNRHNILREVCTLTLHVVCRFEIIRRVGKRCVKPYYEDSPCEIFHSEIEQLIGLRVKRVRLSDKNDLWLDLGDYWVVFATNEDGEESWRLFTFTEDKRHLVASDCLIELEDPF